MQERKCLIVYFKNPKVLKRVKQHGNVSYFHKKRKYAVLYVNADEVEKVSSSLNQLRHVRRVELSQLDDSPYQIDKEPANKDENESEVVK